MGLFQRLVTAYLEKCRYLQTLIKKKNASKFANIFIFAIFAKFAKETFVAEDTFKLFSSSHSITFFRVNEACCTDSPSLLSSISF